MKKKFFLDNGFKTMDNGQCLKSIVYCLLSIVLIVSCSKPKPVEIKPQRKDLTELVFASGDLEADNQYNLTAQTSGNLVKLDLKEGDIVKPGQVVAVIDNSQSVVNTRGAEDLLVIAQKNNQSNAPVFQQIEANIAAAKTKLAQDQVQADRYKRLFDNASVSKIEYENAQLALSTSQTNLAALQEQYNNQKVIVNQQEVSQRTVVDASKVVQENNTVKAIVSGKVYQKKKQLGDYVRIGDVIAVVGNPNLIYAKLNVDENNMSKIKLNQEVAIQLNTNKEKTYKATVHEILPTFDVASQSFLVKAFFKDPLDFRVTGTQLEANILIGEKKNALVIPRIYLGYGNKVKLKDKGDTVIQPGFISSEWVEVTSGLNENDVLILDNK